MVNARNSDPYQQGGLRMVVCATARIRKFDNLADSILDLERQHCENWAKQIGTWDLFLKSQELEGFKAVEASWEKAVENDWHRRYYKKLTSLREPLTLETAPEVFFLHLQGNPEEALKRHQRLVAMEAAKGNVTFFKRIVGELRKSKRRTAHTRATYPMLIFWLHGCLWLMGDPLGRDFLEGITKNHFNNLLVSQSGYTKSRQKLRLVNWDAAYDSPRITGLRKRNGLFTYAEGWTTLEPVMSR